MPYPSDLNAILSNALPNLLYNTLVKWSVAKFEQLSIINLDILINEPTLLSFNVTVSLFASSVSGISRLSESNITYYASDFLAIFNSHLYLIMFISFITLEFSVTFLIISFAIPIGITSFDTPIQLFLLIQLHFSFS